MDHDLGETPDSSLAASCKTSSANRAAVAAADWQGAMVLLQEPFDTTAKHLTQRRSPRSLAKIDGLASGAMNHSYSIIEDEEGPARPGSVP